MNKDLIKDLFPQRKADSHKGTYGKTFILAGSAGMLGAAILASRGALRIGAGLVYLGIPTESRDIVNIATPEVIVIPGNSQGDFNEIIHKADSLAFGPGLGKRRNIARDLLNKLSREKSCKPIVLDADGLAGFNGEIDSIKKLKLNLILTPHPGEMAKLLLKSVDEINKNREKITADLAKQLDCIVILKGYKTVVSDRNGEVYVNQTGNPGLATAGVGDVLTGIIAGLLAQNIGAYKAACAGTYIHGLAGDLAVEDKGEYGMIAGDLVESIYKAIKR